MAAVAPAPPAAAAAASGDASTPAFPRRLRVGIFADGALQPRWLFEALAQVAAGDFAQITVVCTGERPRSSAAPALWRAYETMDRLVFARGARASAPRDIRLLVPASRRLALEAAAAIPN